MTTMVERVARAITISVYNTTFGRVSPVKSDEEFNKHIEREWKNYIPEARAAIEAMREPTEDMLRANKDSGFTWNCIVDCEGVSMAYDMMIDAALKKE